MRFSNVAIDIEGASFRLKTNDKTPTCNNVRLEVLDTDGNWRHLPYVQSFSYSIDQETKVPLIEIKYLDWTE